MADSIWVMCLLLLVDGATFSLFTTPLILHYGKVVKEPTLVALLGGAFSAAGSAIQLLLLRRLLASDHPYMRRFAPSREKVEAAVKAYPSASFAALVLARATPLPDAPLKIVAAAAGYPVGRYALAIFIGALPYYFVLAIAGRKFQPPTWVLVAASLAIGLGVIIDRLRRRGRESG
jgi:uncharacterized membrane protein YdjX (TVP38/TMEM64 family)